LSLLDAVAILAAGLAAGVVNAVAGTGTLLEHRRRADWSAGRPAPASERAPGGW